MFAVTFIGLTWIAGKLKIRTWSWSFVILTAVGADMAWELVR